MTKEQAKKDIENLTATARQLIDNAIELGRQHEVKFNFTLPLGGRVYDDEDGFEARFFFEAQDTYDEETDDYIKNWEKAQLQPAEGWVGSSYRC